MPWDRRQFLLAGGATALASCQSPFRGEAAQPGKLDALLRAHADCLPERVGAGANHYPMAAEAMAALGHEEAIDDSWRSGASLYAGELPRVADLQDAEAALGSYARFGDLLDFFRRELAGRTWRDVVARWAPRLAPGMAGALFHGVIRTGHAVRALRQGETVARRHELAVALAYWAARYAELPARQADFSASQGLLPTLQQLDYPWRGDRADVDFDAVLGRMVESPIAPPVRLDVAEPSPRRALEALVRDATTAFLEMLVLERHRIWLLHSVTAPGCVALLLPEVGEMGARQLVAYVRQGVVALYAAYGAPFEPRAHVRTSPPSWAELIPRGVAARSVHGTKLLEALVRLDRGDDLLWRSVAVQWLEWV